MTLAERTHCRRRNGVIAMRSAEAMASVQTQWRKILVPGNTYAEIAVSNPDRIAIHFISDTNNQTNYIPCFSQFDKSTLLAGNTGSVGLTSFSWPMHGPIIPYSWGCIAAGQQNVFILEIVRHSYGCVPSGVQSQAQRNSDYLPLRNPDYMPSVSPMPVNRLPGIPVSGTGYDMPSSSPSQQGQWGGYGLLNDAVPSSLKQSAGQGQPVITPVGDLTSFVRMTNYGKGNLMAYPNSR